MLRVTTLFIAAAAALGMSSMVSAQTTPPPSYTTAQAAALWGYMSDSWTRSTNGNTNTFSHTPTPSSVPPSATPGNYTTIKRMGDGFTLEQKGYSPVPGRDLAHPVRITKPITHASMAKAFARTLPIVGNALAMKELLEELFPNQTPQFSGGAWSLPGPSVYTNVCVRDAFSSCYAPRDVIHANEGAALSWLQANRPLQGNNGKSHPVSYSLGGIKSGSNWKTVSCTYGPATDGSGATLPPNPECAFLQPADGFQEVPGTPVQITEETLQEKLGSLFQFPPEVDPLLPSIPEQARKDLAEENKGPGVSVIPYTPDGVLMDAPWTHQDAINRWRTGAQGSPIEKTTTTTTIKATPVPDGLRYDTTKTETKQTQQLDPVTGQPMTDPVTGEPVFDPTKTETTTGTTEQTPNKPAEGEDLECGLPGTPPCKIDETGTPAEAPESIEKAADDYKTSMDELRDIVKSSDDKGMFESLRGVFLVPPIAACSPFDLPNDMGSIDPCPVVDGVREVMAYIWALTALWWCLGMIREVI